MKKERAILHRWSYLCIKSCVYNEDHFNSNSVQVLANLVRTRSDRERLPQSGSAND